MKNRILLAMILGLLTLDAAAETLELGAARDLAEDLLDLPVREHARGRFEAGRDGAKPFFRAVERRLRTALPAWEARIERITALPGRTELSVRREAGRETVKIIALRDARLRESTRLIFEERNSATGPEGTLPFLSRTEGRGFRDERLEVGRRAEHFSVAILGRQAGSTIRESGLGVAASVQAKFGAGWTLNVRGEILRMEGTLRSFDGKQSRDSREEAVVRLELRKAVSAALDVGGGAKLRFQGPRGLDQRGVREVFASLGYKLRDGQGHDLGRIEVTGVTEIDAPSDARPYSILVGYTRKF